MTPEQLRGEATAIDRMHGETLTVEWRPRMAERLRAHAAALEELAKVKAALAAVKNDRDAVERDLHESERKIERLKFHAEAMAAAIERSQGYVNAAKAYRAEFKEG